MPLLLKLFLLIYIVTFHKVDYVVGLDKVAIRQSTAAGNFYANSEEMVDYLNGKFNDRIFPTFFFKDIDCSVLDEERATFNVMQFHTVTDYSSFHCMFFSPGRESFIASKLICICDKCKVMLKTQTIRLMLGTLPKFI